MTDVTDDPTGPDTPGPEASAEQDALVRALLASLRTDDPPLPDHVSARLDAVLAEERRQAPSTRSLAGATPDPERADGAPAQGSLASVTVLPTPSRGPSSRSFRLLAGAAAAVVVLGGGAAIVRGGALGNDAGTAGGVSAAMADSSGASLRSTGTTYTRESLTAQASALVTQSRTSPLPTDAQATSAPESAGAAPTTKSLLTPATIPACVEQLAGRPGVAAVAIDQATYEGRAANVIVLPTEDDVTTLEVWVVGPGCTSNDVDLLVWVRIPAP